DAPDDVPHQCGHAPADRPVSFRVKELLRDVAQGEHDDRGRQQRPEDRHRCAHVTDALHVPAAFEAARRYYLLLAGGLSQSRRLARASVTSKLFLKPGWKSLMRKRLAEICKPASGHRREPPGGDRATCMPSRRMRGM